MSKPKRSDHSKVTTTAPEKRDWYAPARVATKNLPAWQARMARTLELGLS